LTQNLQNALGIAGLDGVFCQSSENVLKILRQGKEILLNLLESFIYDPLIDWTGHDTGVLAAFYGGQSHLYEQVTSKKRQVEKDSLVRMFQLRQIEIKTIWIQLGDAIQRTANKLCQRLQDLSEFDENFRKSDSKLNILTKTVEYLKNALMSSEHEFFTIVQRRDNLRKIRDEFETKKTFLIEFTENFDKIVTNGEDAFQTFRRTTFINDLKNFVENERNFFNTSPLVFASDFLQTAGKSTLLHQSEQFDDDLRNSLKIFRVARQPAVENVLKNFVDFLQFLPVDFVQKSTLNKIKDRLNEFKRNFSNFDDFLRFLDEENSPNDLSSRAAAIEEKFVVEIEKIENVETNFSMSSFVEFPQRFSSTLFELWQRARHSLSLSTRPSANNEFLIDEMFTLIQKTFALTSFVDQNELLTISQLIRSFERFFNNLKFRFFVEIRKSLIPILIRSASAKNDDLFRTNELLNDVLQQIQPLASLQTNASVDQLCENIYEKLRSTWRNNPNEISDSFLLLSNFFDELDEHFLVIFQQFQRLEIPTVWLQSPLFDWQQTNINNEIHRRFLKNFFLMTKINTMKQMCQLAIDHCQALENFQLPIVQHIDLLNIVQQYVVLFLSQYLIDLLSFAICYVILSLIPSGNSILETTLIQTDFDFQELLHIVSSNDLNQLEENLEEIQTIWKKLNNENESKQKKISIELRQIERHSIEMQLMAFRWKNVHLLRSTESIKQRKSIEEELTTDENILTVADPTYRNVLEKMLNLEQTVLRQLRWAAGANPSVAEVLNKFETQQKERSNEIETDERLCRRIVELLQASLRFENFRDEFEFRDKIFQKLKILVENASKISQMKIEAENQLNSIEQLIIENPLIDTNVSISTLIEHYENEIVKEKRIRSKDEREFENRRDETNHLVVELKDELTQNNSSFKDISPLLKNLLKIFPHRNLQNYSNFHREFLESCHTVVKHASHIDRNGSTKFDVLIGKVKRILTLKSKVFDDLIQLNPTIDDDVQETVASSTVDKTIKERNKYAVEICKRIRDKLDGFDPDASTSSSISEQVRYTIHEATDLDNLATLYEGWTSWV